MQEAANKQKRMTLKTLHEMLNGMSVDLAEKVHLLFMAYYIDYSDYDMTSVMMGIISILSLYIVSNDFLNIHFISCLRLKGIHKYSYK